METSIYTNFSYRLVIASLSTRCTASRATSTAATGWLVLHLWLSNQAKLTHRPRPSPPLAGPSPQWHCTPAVVRAAGSYTCSRFYQLTNRRRRLARCWALFELSKANATECQMEQGPVQPLNNTPSKMDHQEVALKDECYAKNVPPE